MGIYGLLRLVSWLPELPTACGLGLASLSIMTAVLGILYALGQKQIKRMLAYSSVENIGIIGLSIAVAIMGRSIHQPVLVTLGLGGALLKNAKEFALIIRESPPNPARTECPNKPQDPQQLACMPRRGGIRSRGSWNVSRSARESRRCVEHM